MAHHNQVCLDVPSNHIEIRNQRNQYKVEALVHSWSWYCKMIPFYSFHFQHVLIVMNANAISLLDGIFFFLMIQSTLKDIFPPPPSVMVF